MKLNKYIEHSLLKPDATPAQIQKLCEEALEHGFAAVCINSGYVPLCARLLAGSDVAVGCAVGFPLGSMLTALKAEEVRQAVAAGATEADMVMHVGRAKAGDWDYVQADIAAVVQAAGKVPVKVILECCLLTEEEKAEACRRAVAAGAAYVKTSTGFSKGGATVQDVALLRRTVGPNVGVKAAGGIRTRADALAMIEAGADRLGTSAGIAIIGG